MSGTDERLEQLRKRFRLRSRVDQAALTSAIADQDRAELKRLAHSLAGAGGIFGYAAISAAASALEAALDRDQPAEPEASALLAELQRIDGPSKIAAP
jgi:HPt (histidine-containing phosphotransfer) domain-containing protein